MVGGVRLWGDNKPVGPPQGFPRNTTHREPIHRSRLARFSNSETSFGVTLLLAPDRMIILDIFEDDDDDDDDDAAAAPTTATAATTSGASRYHLTIRIPQHSRLKC